MNSPVALAQAFKIKAASLRDIVAPYLPTELRMGMVVLEAMPAERMVSMFHTHVATPYSASISAKDTAFFLSDAVGTDPILVALRATWADMPEKTHEEIWGIMHTLDQVSRRFVKVTSTRA